MFGMKNDRQKSDDRGRTFCSLCQRYESIRVRLHEEKLRPVMWFRHHSMPLQILGTPVAQVYLEGVTL